MNRNFFRIAGIAVFCASSVLAQSPVAGTATDPVLGTWTLNLGKSKFSPGQAPERGTVSIRRYTLRPDGFMVTVFVTVSPQAEPTFLQVTWKYDNADYRMYAPTSLADFSVMGVSPGTMAYKATDAYTTELTPKDNRGKVTFNGVRRRAVSRDGGTLIDTSRGTNAQGQKVENVLVFDRCKGPCFQLSGY